jgi:hypothetical protein
MADVLRSFSLQYTGGNVSYLRKMILKADLDTSHFLGQAHLRGVPSSHKYTKETFLLSLNEKKLRPGSALLEYLLRFELKERQCEVCNTKTWCDQPIPLEVHHINGCKFDNRLNNLMVLCPNCHAQTENYGNKNKKT